MAMWQHMFGVYVWRSVWRCKFSTQNDIRVHTHQLTSPHRTPYIHTKRKLPHCHNGPFIFLVILNSVTLTRKLELPEDNLNGDRNMLEYFKCF
jgi:hypothetical protein